ncbi:MAG: hypothetical protein HY917_02630, partial [Candidatus Diapherotrites archaeon]|nr:hypothetical protein [Candidatus Diapherotrites archaeon]
MKITGVSHTARILLIGIILISITPAWAVNYFDLNFVYPITGTYQSGRHSVDFNFRDTNNNDTNFTLYIDNTLLVRDRNLNASPYCFNPDKNNSTRQTCQYINTPFGGLDLNVDFNLFTDGNHTLTIDLNSSPTDSNRFTSNSFVIDNHAPATATLSINDGNASTNSPSFSLTLSATDAIDTNAYQMQFSCTNAPYYDSRAVISTSTGNITGGGRIRMGDLDGDGDNDLVAM